jgi:hypothetical protein
LQERGKFLGSFCKEGSVFEHVPDFLIDALEGGTQPVRNGGGFFGFQAGKSPDIAQAWRRIRKKLTFNP